MSAAASVAGAPPTVAPRSAADDAASIERLRRLDWRFLLPRAGGGRVAYAGPGRDALLPALRERHPTLIVLDRDDVPGAERFDLVVLQCPDPAGLERAAARLAPGGLLYAELPRRGRGAVLRHLPRLRRLGVGTAALHGHHPDFERCRWIVPLDAPGALSFLLRRTGRVPPAAARRIAGAAAGSGIAARLAPCVSVLLRRDGGPPPGPLPRLLGGASSDGLSCLLLTPRFRASAHVVSLLVAESGEPKMVAKEARLPEPSPTLRHEAETLRALRRARPGGFDSVPRLVAYREDEGGCALLETALPGREVRPADARTRRAALAEAILAWTVELHDATRRDAAPGEALAEAVDAPLARFATAWPASTEDAALLAATREATRPLATLAIPRVAAHGDLAAPNLLLGGDGRLRVVDWELADAGGLPCEDLFFALAWLATAGAGTPRDRAAAFHGAFFGAAAWARPYVARYAEHAELPGEALAPLLVAGRARYVAARAGRLRGAAGPLPAEAAAWLRADRHFALWRHAALHAGEIRLAGGAASSHPTSHLRAPCPPSP